jgi:hypothetical protein
MYYFWAWSKSYLEIAACHVLWPACMPLNDSRSDFNIKTCQYYAQVEHLFVFSCILYCRMSARKCAKSTDPWPLEGQAPMEQVESGEGTRISKTLRYFGGFWCVSFPYTTFWMILYAMLLLFTEYIKMHVVCIIVDCQS